MGMRTEGDYCVGQYRKDGTRVATMSGMGNNKGKWEARHHKRTAQKYARELNARGDGFIYQAEEMEGEGRLRPRNVRLRPELVKAYHKGRGLGCNATNAMWYARESLKEKTRPDIEWNMDETVGTVEYKGFVVRISVDVDTDADSSYLGEFKATESAKTIRRNPANVEHNHMAFFEPGNSLEGHRKGLRGMGYGKHEAYTLARSYVLNDLKRLEELNNGDWCYYHVNVTASKQGVELGEDSIGGVDDAKYARGELARKLIESAVSSAQKKLQRLKKGGK